VSNEQRDIVERMNAWFNEKGHSLGYSTYEMLREAAEEITTLCRRVENATNGAKFWTDAHEAMCKHLWTVVQPRDGLPCDVLAIQEIERLRKIESDAKAANMIGHDGNVRKVNGTIAVDAEGVIVANGAKLFDVLGNTPVMAYIMVNHGRGNGWVQPDIRFRYSTPASERGEKA